MTSSLVGSEMCIRDSLRIVEVQQHRIVEREVLIDNQVKFYPQTSTKRKSCLLYTSDAADDM
eukprot:4598555-Prorocentrum_lima.AAC.1